MESVSDAGRPFECVHAIVELAVTRIACANNLLTRIACANSRMGARIVRARATGPIAHFARTTDNLVTSIVRANSRMGDRIVRARARAGNGPDSTFRADDGQGDIPRSRARTTEEQDQPREHPNGR